MMRRLTACLTTVLLLLATAPSWAQTQTWEQVIELQPGWNSIYVQVTPEDNQLSTVFADLPIASVWRWIPTQAGARFIEDPAEGLENIEGWFAWFPEPRPEAFLSNLFRMDANTAYLVRLEGSQPATITISGRPEFIPLAWQTNAFTLTGLPVAETNPPTFAEFFERSGAHQGQPIYELDANGRWEVIDPANTAIDSNTAYWIFTDGNSAHQGKLGVVLDGGESLEFTAALEQTRLVLRNRSEQDGSFVVRRLGTAGMPLVFLNEDPDTGDIGWPSLSQSLFLDAPAGQDVFLNIGPARRDFTASRMEEVLEITDEFGERVLLHVGGNTLQPFVAPAVRQGATAASEGAVMNGRGTGSPSLAGLWLGEVEINAVSESQLAGVTPVEAPQTFSQRFIIHVDSAGQARLLKDVIQMWEEGTLVPSDEDPSFNEVEEPGRFVLITDTSLISLYTGAINRAGTSVGQRYSTVAYDFAGDTLAFEGDFSPTGQINTTLVIEPELPTNPFLHQFHPDHDNRDAQFLNFQQEAYQVVREIRLEF
ncbi:MAG: hypothetical protein AAGH65_04830, partial [Pseudomonadota bacterium]